MSTYDEHVKASIVERLEGGALEVFLDQDEDSLEEWVRIATDLARGKKFDDVMGAVAAAITEEFEELLEEAG